MGRRLTCTPLASRFPLLDQRPARPNAYEVDEVNWYLAVLKNYTGFSGRARRREHWTFFFIHLAILLVLFGIGVAVGATFLSSLYGLAVLLPLLALCSRRLHDTGRSAKWIFIGFLPIIGQIVLLVFYVQDSQPGVNQYGPSPKGLPAEAQP